ncbi:MAG: glycoside hydrolase family 3 C-terminal domain-containing protein, partial [Bacteroidales bacterium]|nr:glycoside hydrolase family 3 C-terminal domain-containing protein [Bacteroidales bacterium]
IPMAVHPCLNEVARKEWGNNGIICTDGGAFSLLLTAYHYYPDLTAAAAGVVKAGTSQFLDRFLPNLKEAVEKSLVTEADIENAISGNIYVALKLGLLDDKCPYANIGKDTTAMPPYEREEVKQFVREVTAKSIVLLKNENQTLPINPQKVKKIAVVGHYADKIIYDWYSGTAPYENTILKAMQDVGKQNGIEILYAPDNQFGRAEDLAKEADMVLVCTGNHPYGTDRTWKVCPVPSDGREANDRHSLQLPDEDEIRRLYAINPNIVLVLVSSFPYAINWSNDHLPAIIHVTHCSQEQGYGVTDVLFGKVNPAGRTNQTWVRDILDLPHILDYDIRHGRTYMYFKGEALYPFGYGLSYTSFNYEQSRVQKQDKQNVYVSVSITNTGKRDGDEVVQLYASYPESKVEHPKRQLKAFERVSIPAGQTKEVILKVSKSDLSYWDETRHSFVPETGRIQLEIGASSADIRKVIFLD